MVLESWQGGIIKEMTVVAKETSVTIGNLRPDYEYQFRVLAGNTLGLSNASKPVTVITAEEGKFCHG